MSRSNPPLFLNVYQVNRAYGGPEEGGWWYDYGIFLAGLKLKRSEKKLRPIKRTDFHNVLNQYGYPIYNKQTRKPIRLRKPTVVITGHQAAPTSAAYDKWEAQALHDFADYHDGMHGISSVICDGNVRLHTESSLGENYPSERPHYE